MFGMSRRNSFDDVFNLHREVDRLFNQVWSEMPLRTAASPSLPFSVRSSDDGWTVDVPMPGIDPRNVRLEVAGNTLSIHAESSNGEQDAPVARYEQSLTVPQFVDLDKLAATHRHGMLQLTLPIKDSVKPRRIEIQTHHDDQRQLATGAK
jgi:HSP20 family protein